LAHKETDQFVGR